VKSKVDRILKDLYRIDPELRGREEELKKAIEKLLASKPEAEMDELFERELKEKLFSSFSEQEKKRRGLRFVLARPAFKAGIGAVAACLLVAAVFQFKPWVSLSHPSAETGAGLLVPLADERSQAPKASVDSKLAPAGPAPQAAAPVRDARDTIAPNAHPASAPVTTARESIPHNALLALTEADKKKELDPVGPPVASALGKLRAASRAPEELKLSSPKNMELEARTPAAVSPKPSKKDAASASAAPDALANRYNDDFDTEGYDRIVENSFAKVVEEPLSTFSIDVDTASYANVRRFIDGGSLPPPDAVRIEELVNYFAYDYEGPKGDEPFAFDTELAPCPWNQGDLLLRVALQAKRIDAKDIPPSNLVFLVDVSGSMEDENKLPLVKESLKKLARQMRQEDRISIVVYAGNAGLVLEPTPGSRKDAILKAIDDLEAGGSTAGGKGIELAYATAKKTFMPKGNNRVILATDGDFNVGASSDGALVRLIEKKRKEGVFLTVLGFGMGNYKDSKMQKLADSGNGNYAYIDTLSEAEKVLSKQMAGTLYTVAKDVKVQIEFNPAIVGEYRLVGYEKRALAARDFADDTKDAGELGAGSSVTALYEIRPSKGVATRSDLKYQSTTSGPAATSGELMTIKFRYKKPEGEASILVETPVDFRKVELAKSSGDFRFAAAVAEWGLILRESQYKGSSSFTEVERLASEARGRDAEGYRAEFLRLVKLSAKLAK
jgi:Ca-activated chloride channel homolog